MGARSDAEASKLFEMILAWQNETDAKLDVLTEAVARLQSDQEGLPVESALAALKNEFAKKLRQVNQEIQGHQDGDVLDV